MTEELKKQCFKFSLFLSLCELKIESTSVYIPWFPMGTLFWGPMENRRGNPPVVNILKPVGVLCWLSWFLPAFKSQVKKKRAELSIKSCLDSINKITLKRACPSRWSPARHPRPFMQSLTSELAVGGLVGGGRLESREGKGSVKEGRVWAWPAGSQGKLWVKAASVNCKMCTTYKPLTGGLACLHCGEKSRLNKVSLWLGCQYLWVGWLSLDFL